MEKRQLIVIGGGPGGYPAAFLAADAGLQVTLVDEEPTLGGVCLHRGCIPSKALLHVARTISDARAAASWGIAFTEPTLDLPKLRAFKDRVVQKLSAGLGTLCQQRGVEFVQGRATLTSPQILRVVTAHGTARDFSFDHVILATGSRPATLPGLPPSPRIWDSSKALELECIPTTLLVVGGGYIGLELGSAYASLGSRVTVVEMLPTLLPGADADLVRPLTRHLEKIFARILTGTRVADMTEQADGIRVRFEGPHVDVPQQVFDRVLIAVGRRPNTEGLGLEHTNVRVNAAGFIETDAQRRTHEPAIFAVGDVAGGLLLAHKATHEGRVAMDAVLGRSSAFQPRAIPAVVFTDPELAWCGLSEAEARAQGIPHRTARYPWSASGRAATLDRTEGLTKLIVEAESGRLLGVGIVGPGAGELISEAALALELGAKAEDLARTIHPHPTLSETLMEAADAYLGRSVHVLRRRA